MKGKETINKKKNKPAQINLALVPCERMNRKAFTEAFQGAYIGKK